MKINYKSAEVVLGVILAIQILVMLIDLDTKNRIVKESVKLREDIKDVGQRISGANHKGNRPDGGHNGPFSGGVVDNGIAGMATESAVSEGPGDDESFQTPH